MGMIQTPAYFYDNIYRLGYGETAIFDTLFESISLDIVHNKIRLARLSYTKVQDIDDIWMAELPGGSGFLLKADQLFVILLRPGQNFYRHFPFENRVLGGKYQPHAPGSQQRRRAVTPQKFHRKLFITA